MPKRLTKAQFIQRSRRTHGGKYDYSKTRYRGTRQKVLIRCPDHGLFLQRADDHMAGRGCPDCSGNASLSSDAFIRKAYKVHGTKYSYGYANPRGTRSKVVIVCPKHGKFLQRADDHIAGRGCHKCTYSRGEDKVGGWLIKHGIKHIRQKRVKFKRRTLVFDFYLPARRTFIEYHGRQHYEAIAAWGGEKRFIQQRVRDTLARLYCEEKKYKYIEIPYTEYDRVGDILSRLT